MNILILSTPSNHERTHRIVRRATEAAVLRLSSLGHDVNAVDLTTFSPVLTREEMCAYVTDQPLIDEQTEVQAQAILACDALVVFYGSILSTLPPALKGWLERVLVPGVSFSLDGAGGTTRGLSGLNWIIGVAVYEESWSQTKRFFDNGRRILLRNLRLCAHWKTRTAWVPLYSVANATTDDVDRFVTRVERTMAKL